MLTNLNFLTPGATWPPPSEKKRIEKYEENERLFLTDHAAVWQEKFAKLAAKFKKKNYAADTPINYHQLISKKTADFVCGMPPKLETEGDTDGLTRMLSDQNFFARLYEAVIDVSRFGDAPVKIVGREAYSVAPRYWDPVVDPTNLKKVIYDVIAYPTDFDADGKPTKLYAEIHSPGQVETRWYEHDATARKLGRLIETKTLSTGLDRSAVFVLKNLTHSGSIYGLDDYNIVNDIISKIMWRLHCADTVLDKHSEPSISGPASALQYDERTKMWYVPLGNYFKRESAEDPDLHYVTWDGNLESNWKELEMLINQLYILSEMGQAFADAGGSSDSSGTALKLRMVSPRIKAQRIVGINAATVKSIIAALAKLNNIKVDYNTLKIDWSDGLPIDDVELINMLTSATGGKAVMSQYTALKKLGLSDDDVEAEQRQMRNEDAEMLPTEPPNRIGLDEGGNGDLS